MTPAGTPAVWKTPGDPEDTRYSHEARHDIAGEAAQIVVRSLAAQQHAIDPDLSQRVELRGNLS
ncbi:MAG: hypothetical protein AB7H90_04600 [Alphaproteobacteria bacterium]